MMNNKPKKEPFGKSIDKIKQIDNGQNFKSIENLKDIKKKFGQ